MRKPRRRWHSVNSVIIEPALRAGCHRVMYLSPGILRVIGECIGVPFSRAEFYVKLLQNVGREPAQCKCDRVERRRKRVSLVESIDRTIR